MFGLTWSGGMTAKRIAGLIRNLPPGSSEIYTHPATSGDFDGAAQDYAYTSERRGAPVLALPGEAIRETAAAVGGYADLTGAP